MALAISLGSYFDTLAAFLRSTFSANGSSGFWGSWVTAAEFGGGVPSSVVVRSINTMPLGAPAGPSPPRAGAAAVAVDSEGPVPCCTSCVGGVADPRLGAALPMPADGAAASEGEVEALGTAESVLGRG